MNGNKFFSTRNNFFAVRKKFFTIGITLCLLLTLMSSAFSQANVIVLPKMQSQPLALYPHEIAEYMIRIENTGNVGIENFNLKVSLDEGLMLFDGFDKMQAKVFTIPILEAFGKREIEFQILLDLDYSDVTKDKKFLINAEYGTDTYTNFAGTFLTVRKEPLFISTSLTKSVMDAGEDNALEFVLENKSDEELSQINASLLLPPSIYIKGSDKVFISSLKSKEKLSNNKLEFSTDPLIEDTKPIALQISYNDSNGFHLIRKDSEIAIKHFSTIYYFGILIVLALIVLLVFKIKKKKKSEHEKIVDAKYVEKA